MYVVSAFSRTSRSVRLKPDTTTYYMEPKTALISRMRSRTRPHARTAESLAALTTGRQAVVADIMHGVIAQPRGIGRSQTTVARARLDAAIDGIPRKDRIGCGVPAHQPHLDVIRGQTTQPHGNWREMESDAIAIGHLRTARVKRGVRGVETITLAPAQVVVQPRARELAPDLDVDLLVVFAQPAHIALAPPAQPLE